MELARSTAAPSGRGWPTHLHADAAAQAVRLVADASWRDPALDARLSDLVS
jgi:hypothetical protein